MPDKHFPADPATYYFACPLCGKALDVRLSKKNRPYVTCDECSLQLFVRGPAGIGRFDRLARSEDGRTRAERPQLIPEPKLPRGRPRKNPEVTERVERLGATQPIKLLTGRAP